MTSLHESARSVAARNDPDRALGRVARFGLEASTPDTGTSEQIVTIASQILADPDAFDDEKDACTLAVARAATKLLPLPASGGESVEVANRVLKEQGWSAHAMRLAGSTLSDEAPDRSTAHDIASVAAMVMAHRAHRSDVAGFADVSSPEAQILAATALRRVHQA